MRSAPVFLHAVLTPALAKSLAVEGTREFAFALELLLYTRVQQAGNKARDNGAAHAHSQQGCMQQTPSMQTQPACVQAKPHKHYRS
jgi:hypothetical protein